MIAVAACRRPLASVAAKPRLAVAVLLSSLQHVAVALILAQAGPIASAPPNRPVLVRLLEGSARGNDTGNGTAVLGAQAATPLPPAPARKPDPVPVAPPRAEPRAPIPTPKLREQPRLAVAPTRAAPRSSPAPASSSATGISADAVPATSGATTGAAASASGSGSPGGESGEGGNAVGNSYRARILAWLDRHKRYPARARALGLEGRIVLRLALDRDGRVRSQSLESEDRYAVFAREAEAMVRRADPFPAVPESIPGSTFELVVPIDFHLAPAMQRG